MTCCACGRRFGGLTGFDKHQKWIYFDDRGFPKSAELQCYDPATLTRRDGSPLFKLDARGVWVLFVGKIHPHSEGTTP